MGCCQIVGDHGTGKSTLVMEMISAVGRQPSAASVLSTQRWSSGATPGGLRRSARIGAAPGGTDSVPIRLLQLHSDASLASRWGHARSLLAGLWSCRQSVWVVDGAEQLPAPVRPLLWGVARMLGKRVLATSHRRLIGLPVLHQTSVNPAVIRDLLQDLSGPDAEPLTEVLDIDGELHDVTNVRDYFAELYERYEQRRI